jgi:hypothetical protein
VEQITSSLEGAKLIVEAAIVSSKYTHELIFYSDAAWAYLFTDGQQWEVVVKYTIWPSPGPRKQLRTVRAVDEKIVEAIKKVAPKTDGFFDSTNLINSICGLHNWTPDQSISPTDAFRIGNWINADKRSRHYRP